MLDIEGFALAGFIFVVICASVWGYLHRDIRCLECGERMPPLKSAYNIKNGCVNSTTCERENSFLLIEIFKTTKWWPPGSTLGGLSYMSGSVVISHFSQSERLKSMQ
jgi:hypothetical protein